MQIAEKAIAFLQRTASYSLVYQGDSSELVAYCDASFAPDGAKESLWVAGVSQRLRDLVEVGEAKHYNVEYGRGRVDSYVRSSIGHTEYKRHAIRYTTWWSATTVVF